MVARCGSNRPRHGSPPKRCSPRRNTSSPGRSTPRPTHRHRRRPSSATGSMCCRPRQQPRWPATTVSCWWSARPVPARPACSPPPSTDLHAQRRPCSGSPRRRKRPGYWSGTPGCAPTPSPNCSTSGSGPTGRHYPSTGCAAGTTVVVDEAGMLSTPALHQLVSLAEANRWRLVLVGDHRQLQAVGRGGLFAELCANGRVDELERLHRFTHDWEAAASLQLRSGDPRALDAYEAHDRIIPGTPRRPPRRDGRDRGSNTTPAAKPSPSSPRRMIMSTPSTAPSRPPESPPDSSTRTSPRRSPAESALTSVTSSPPAATTAPSSPRPASRCATGRPGPSRRSGPMVR